MADCLHLRKRRIFFYFLCRILLTTTIVHVSQNSVFTFVCGHLGSAPRWLFLVTKEQAAICWNGEKDINQCDVHRFEMPAKI